jgi:hypothetical protein
MHTGAELIAQRAIAMLPPLMRDTIKQYFAYTAEFLPLAASLTGTVPFTVEASSDFIVVAMTGVVTDVANTTFLGMVPQTIQIVDASTGMAWFNGINGTHFNNVMGDAQQPYFMPLPFYLRANSTVNVTLVNLEAVQRNVRLAFHGFKSVPGSNWETGFIGR